MSLLTRTFSIATTLLAASVVVVPLPGGTAHVAADGVWYGTVNRIEDGDTFFVDVDGIGEQRVRIAGMNTNEANASGNCYAAEATARLTQLIDGKRVELRARDAGSTTGGRPLRHVFIGGANVGATMLREGLAVPLLFQIEPDYADSYQGAWWEANRAGRGVSNPNLCGAGPYASDFDVEMITNGDADESDVTNQNGEWVILRNHGSSSIDLSGWQIKDNSVAYYEFPNGTVLGSNGWLQIFTGSGSNGGNELYMNFPGPIWSTTDAAYLLDPDGDIRLFDMWPCQGLCDAAPIEDLVIDAVQWDVPGPDTANDEWIRIKNVGTATVDFEDWGVASWPHIVHSGPRTIAPGATVTVYGGFGSENSSRFYFENAGPMLDTVGDIALLIDPSGNVADCESFGTSDCTYSPANGHRSDDLPDVNGDGYSDMIVGAPGEDIGSIADGGAFSIRYGDDPGIRTADGNNFIFSDLRSTSLSQAGPVAGTVESGDRLGSAMTFGDFDGDGYDDVVAGAPGEDIGSLGDAGAINVFYGSPLGAQIARNQSFSQSGPIVGGPEAGDRFGATLASGDFNRDGYDDLAVGAPGENNSTGTVHILFGSPAGITTAGNLMRGQSGASAETGDSFGAALDVGDFNADGYDDLAVGAPGEDVGSLGNAGAIFVFSGTSAGPAPSALNFGQWGAITGTPEAGDRFGSSLAAGDFDGDGDDDLAIGAPGEDIGSLADAGIVHVLKGQQGSGLSTSGNKGFYQGAALPGGAETGDLVGSALDAGDFDGDGRDDLAIGAPGEAIGSIYGAGLVQVAFGSESGISGARAQSLYQGPLAGAAEAGDHLGAAVRVVDYDGDGMHDVLIGMPGEDIGSRADAGAAALVFGSRSGVDTNRDINLTQWSVGGGANEAGDEWGIAL